jgi:hypothetical protein
MKAVHEVRFPRYSEDVMSEKRTIFHVLGENAANRQPFSVGDGLRLLAAPNFPRCKVATITKVDRVQLCQIDDDDLRRLNVPDAATYLSCWDALHPEVPSIGNPEVWRIEFEYGVSKDDGAPVPEWCLAS